MSRQHHRHKRLKLRSLYVWHRYMGVSAAFFVLLVAVTGLLLNHTEDFELDSRFVESEHILDWYGITAPEQLRIFSAGQHYIALLGERLYLDQHMIPGDYRVLAGAAELQGMLVIAVDRDLLLFTPDGELIERLPTGNGLPAAIEQLSTATTDTLLVRTEQGVFQSDSALLRWTRRDGEAETLDWIAEVTPDRTLQLTLQQRYRARILPLERLILDLHSGRLFGGFGVWLFDIAAVVLILLALSGTLIWLKRKR